jgi:hypothetical protein
MSSYRQAGLLAFATYCTAMRLRTLGIEVQPLEVRSPDDFDSAFETVRQQYSDASITVEDPLTASNQKQIVKLAITITPGFSGMQ